MSVTAGKYFGSKVSYAAGAPRSNGTGQVVIFTKVKKAESQLRVQLVLSGEQFASSYGYQVATADLNGDRYKSIIFFLCVVLPRFYKSIRTRQSRAPPSRVVSSWLDANASLEFTTQ